MNETDSNYFKNSLPDILNDPMNDTINIFASNDLNDNPLNDNPIFYDKSQPNKFLPSPGLKLSPIQPKSLPSSTSPTKSLL